MSKVDNTGLGSEVRTPDNINDDTNLDVCKLPPTLEEVENTDFDISTAIDNAVSESNNDCATDMEELDEGDKVPHYPFGM